MASYSPPDHAVECRAPPMHIPSTPNRPAVSNKHEKPISAHSDLQTTWEETMKGVGGLGLPHKNCAVLLVNWEKDSDDLHTGKEVDDLGDVFESLYNYTVTKKQLLGTGRSSQLQVQKILIDFVFEHDAKEEDDDQLLIVYYAGHGVPGMTEGGGRGGLHLAGRRSPNRKTDPKDIVVWDEAEVLLKRTKGDVLVIFDCCHAGALAKMTRSASNRSFEFLAACGANERTAMPGDNSFTSALIWSLKALATKESFNTHQLLRKVNEKAPNFPRDQHALIMERGEDETSCVRKLVLAPLRKNGEKIERGIVSDKTKPTDIRLIKHYIDLRCFYDKPPSKNEVQFLSESLKHMILNEKITARHIGWLGMTDIIRHAADTWSRRATIKGNTAPVALRWAQKFAAAARRKSDVHFPITPPPSESGLDSTFETSPETLIVQKVGLSTIDSVEHSSVGNIEMMNVAHSDNINVNIGNMSTSNLRKLLLAGPHSRYKLEIFIVGLVVLVLEFFHRLQPREAPVIVLLSFCAYAWYMSNVYHGRGVPEETSRLSSYLPLIIGGISLSVCWKLLFPDRGITT